MKMSETGEDCLQTIETSFLRSEITNLENEVAAKDREIARISAVKNQFVRMVAHDLRNPLGIILAFSGFLSDETKEILTNAQKDYLKRIHNSTNFMLTLISDLIEITNMESGKFTIDADILDIVSIVSEKVKTKSEVATEKNISISFESTDDVVYVYADAKRMEQVFNILFTNAMMYSDPYTTIAVRISKENESVRIRISDKGTGIAVQDLGKIFIPFEKVPHKGTNGEKVTGLGLAIVKWIVEEHRGEIIVESEPGIGSSFIVVLPVK